jgi:hypothetical protein
MAARAPSRDATVEGMAARPPSRDATLAGAGPRFEAREGPHQHVKGSPRGRGRAPRWHGRVPRRRGRSLRAAGGASRAREVLSSRARAHLSTRGTRPSQVRVRPRPGRGMGAVTPSWDMTGLAGARAPAPGSWVASRRRHSPLSWWLNGPRVSACWKRRPLSSQSVPASLKCLSWCRESRSYAWESACSFRPRVDHGSQRVFSCWPSDPSNARSAFHSWQSVAFDGRSDVSCR